MKSENLGRGGAREGAGRPAIPENEKAKIRSIRLSDEDWRALGRLAKTENMSRATWISNKIQSFPMLDLGD